MTSARRWLLVRPSLIATFACAYALLEAAGAMIRWRDKLAWTEVAGPQIRHLEGIVLIAFASIYGFVRATGSHPINHSKYRRWLMLTPWTPRQALPLGPITFVLRDLLIVAPTLGLCFWHQSVDPLRILSAFLIGFVVPTMLTLAASHQASVILLLVGLPALAHLWPSELETLIGAAALYAIAHFALRRSLRDFPWMDWPPKIKRPQVGWPFDKLGPQHMPDRKSLAQSVGVGLLLAWWLFTIARVAERQIDSTTDRDFRYFELLTVFSIAAIRWLVYRAGYAPPITTLGRLVTGRLIIPAYDRIYVGPLGVIATNGLASGLLQHTSLPIAVRFALSVSAALVAALSIGPSLRDWRLTGAHRIHSTGSATNVQRERAQLASSRSS